MYTQSFKIHSFMQSRTYPRNFVPGGPISIILLARASPSFRTGGWSSFSFLISRQRILVGMEALPGGMTNRIPLWRVPRMAPPLASTMKLTRKLRSMIVIFVSIFGTAIYIQNKSQENIYPLYICYRNIYKAFNNNFQEMIFTDIFQTILCCNNKVNPFYTHWL